MPKTKPTRRVKKDDQLDVTTVRTCRRLFLKAAAEHEEVLLEDSLYDHVFKKLREGPELESLLCEWACEKRLNYPWVRREARNLYYWSRIPNSDKLFPAHFGDSQPASAQPFYLTWAADEDPKDCENRNLARFKKVLADFISQGTLDRKPLRGRSQKMHYRWAVENVCLGRTHHEIADKYSDLYPNGLSNAAVGDAIRKVLTKIGIPRPSRTKNKLTSPQT